MKQFVTSSSPLTFTGWRPVGLKGALLGNHDRGKIAAEIDFVVCTRNKINRRWEKKHFAS